MSRRTERVNDLLQEELAELLLTHVKDPRVGQGLVSITEVVVSPDLRHANVYVSHLGNEAERAEVMKGLEHSQSYLHNELTKRLKLRYVPAIHFKLDPSLERGARLATLINTVAGSVDPAALDAKVDAPLPASAPSRPALSIVVTDSDDDEDDDDFEDEDSDDGDEDDFDEDEDVDPEDDK